MLRQPTSDKQDNHNKQDFIESLVIHDEKDYIDTYPHCIGYGYPSPNGNGLYKFHMHSPSIINHSRIEWRDEEMGITVSTTRSEQCFIHNRDAIVEIKERQDVIDQKLPPWARLKYPKQAEQELLLPTAMKKGYILDFVFRQGQVIRGRIKNWQPASGFFTINSNSELILGFTSSLYSIEGLQGEIGIDKSSFIPTDWPKLTEKVSMPVDPQINSILIDDFGRECAFMTYRFESDGLMAHSELIDKNPDKKCARHALTNVEFDEFGFNGEAYKSKNIHYLPREHVSLIYRSRVQLRFTERVGLGIKQQMLGPVTVPEYDICRESINQAISKRENLLFLFRNGQCLLGTPLILTENEIVAEVFAVPHKGHAKQEMLKEKYVAIGKKEADKVIIFIHALYGINQLRDITEIDKDQSNAKKVSLLTEDVIDEEKDEDEEKEVQGKGYHVQSQIPLDDLMEAAYQIQNATPRQLLNLRRHTGLSLEQVAIKAGLRNKYGTNLSVWEREAGLRTGMPIEIALQLTKVYDVSLIDTVFEGQSEVDINRKYVGNEVFVDNLLELYRPAGLKELRQRIGLSPQQVIDSLQLTNANLIAELEQGAIDPADLDKVVADKIVGLYHKNLDENKKRQRPIEVIYGNLSHIHCYTGPGLKCLRLRQGYTRKQLGEYFFICAGVVGGWERGAKVGGRYVAKLKEFLLGKDK